MNAPQWHDPTDDAEGPERVNSLELPGFRPLLTEAMELLRRARLHAADAGRDAWDFAVEASSLRRCGLTPTDFRWLICKGYVLHGIESAEPAVDRRYFTSHAGWNFTKHSCFVLTDEGLDFANALSPLPLSFGSTRLGAAASDSVSETLEIVNDEPQPARPQWDFESRELRFRGRLIKQFKVPSPNQEIVIMAFEEESWPTFINDPLPPRGDCDPKQRLHDTIRSLNRNQKNRLLRFKGNGTGEGVLWEPIGSLAAGNPQRAR